MLPRFSLPTYLKSLSFLGVLMAAATCYAAPAAAPSIPPGDLGVIWSASQPENTIKNFTPDDLKKVKRIGSTELDPATGKKARFHGLLLSDLIEQAMTKMSNDQRALIDLVILRNPQGTLALIPRSFIVKYPMMLADHENGKALNGLKSVAPWTSHSKTRSEGLPLETYFVTDVNEVDLANYHLRYGNVFLKERDDPVALRGEKIFIQGCLGCHDSRPGMAKARDWTGTHPKVNGSPQLKIQEARALKSYLQMFKSENTATAAK